VSPRDLPLCLAVAGLVATLLAAPAPGQESDELEDILGGFEDEDPAFEVEPAPTGALERPPIDLSGSVEVSSSINLVDHRSDTDTDYYGLQRLRNRGNLQLDVELGELPHLEALDDWQLRLEGWGFYDAAYAIRGRSRYTREVLREYELDAVVGEAWLHGEIAPGVDVTAGREVVIWGRSETLRVLDVLNPLDTREPGRVDLADLRRPLSMLQVKGYADDWSLAAIAIPEIRFDANPVLGSDFFPGTVDLPEERPHHFEDVELAAALTTIRSGWDLSFHGAWCWDDRARADGAFFPTELVHDRLWLVGTGGNFTTGSWLLKAEVAYVDGLGFFGLDGEKSRLDALAGVEYYGLTETTVVLEAVNRHLFDYESALRRAPAFTRRDTAELALRIRRNFWNDTLHATLVGIALGWDAGDGSIVRFDVDYDVMDALVVGAGLLLYQKGDLPPLDGWADNDRVLLSVKWSF
jgi:hypothetical protein